MKAMRIRLPIFDQDRTLGVSTTQSVGKVNKLANGTLKFELSPYVRKDKDLNKWMVRCSDQLKKSRDDKFKLVKESVEAHLNNQTAMQHMIYFYENSIEGSPGSVHWRLRSVSESLIMYPVSCYIDTNHLVYFNCKIPKNLSDFNQAANIVLNKPG